MKRTYLFGTMMAFGLAGAATVGAQQDRPAQSASDRQGQNVVVTGCLKSGTQMASGTASGTAGTAGTAGATGTSGTTTPGAGPSSGFILTDAKLTSGSESPSGSATATPAGSATGTATGSTAGTSGTTGSATAAAYKDKAKSYALVGGQQSELQGYLNSKVEISGTIDPSASGTSTSGSGATATGTSTGTATTGSTGSTGTTASGTGSGMSGMTHASDHARLRVTSVRQIAGTCDASQR